MPRTSISARARVPISSTCVDRVLRHLLGVQTVLAEVAAGSVVVARDLPPSLFLGFDWSQGGAIVLGEGSATSHVAMLARARGVPHGRWHRAASRHAFRHSGG